MTEPETCSWTEDNEGVWDTSCGQTFIITEGTPTENDMRFCCYCGSKLVVSHRTPTAEDNE